VITTKATGPGSLIQSRFGPRGNFEVLVPEGSSLVHYYFDATTPSQPWQAAEAIAIQATGSVSFIQSTFGAFGNWEAIVPEGHNLVHYWRDNNIGGNPAWQRGAVISPSASPEACVGPTLTASPMSPQLAGTRVTLTASTAGCWNPQYQFWVRGPNSVWNVLRPYASGPTAMWSTSGLAPGSYAIEVWVKDAFSSQAYDTYAYLTFTVQ